MSSDAPTHGTGLESAARDPYLPIACSFHDQIEAAATLRRVVSLTYSTSDGQKHLHGQQIVDVGARNGAEYLRLSSGLELRLDTILTLDGWQP